MGGSAFFTTLETGLHSELGVPMGGRYEISAGSFVTDGTQIPARELGRALERTVRGPARIAPLWSQRAWYPYLLAPLWLLALLVARVGVPARTRPTNRAVGFLLLGVTAGLALFEAVYLQADYASFLPGAWGALESVAVWCIVCGVLLWRRRGDRAIGAVEATVAAQALLGFMHMVTLPSTMARPWVGAHPLDRVLRSVIVYFPPAFWITCGGLLLIALPVYLRRPRA